MGDRPANLELDDAIRRVEKIEHELADMDGMTEIRRRLTDARSDLVDALIQEEYERLREE